MEGRRCTAEVKKKNFTADILLYHVFPGCLSSPVLREGNVNSTGVTASGHAITDERPRN